MTDPTPTETEDSAHTEAAPNWRRELEARAKRADELETELGALKRREVFRDAGLNVSDKMTDYFMRGYEGDLTVEAITAEAASAGLTAERQPEDPAVNAGAGGEQRIAAAADDAGPVTDPDLNTLIRQTTNEAELRTLIEANGGTWGAAV